MPSPQRKVAKVKPLEIRGDDDDDIKEDLDDPLNMEGKYLTDLYISIYFLLVQSNLAIRNFLVISKLFTNANLFINY